MTEFHKDENGNIVETIGTWEIKVWSWDIGKKASVEIEDKVGCQSATLEDDGDLFIEVHPNEKGRGWEGDCASGRKIPMQVIIRATDIWRALREEKT